MTDIVPPHSIPAEQSVLGALMQAPERLHDVADWLTSGDFYRRDHALIFQAITEQAAKGQPVDAVTLADWFEGVELADQVGGLGYLVDLSRTTPSAANLVAYAEIVVEKSRLRRLAEAGGRIAEMALEPNARASADVAAEAEAMLRALAPSPKTGPVDASAGLKELHAEIEALFEGTAELGLPYPWADLTRCVRLVPGEVTLLAARPSVGKSALGFQVATFIARMGFRTLVNSLEMPRKSVFRRMVSCVGSVPYAWLRNPANGEDHWARYAQTVRELVGAPLLIDDGAGLAAAQIVARARREHFRSPLRLLVIDHLHEVRMAGRQGEVIERPEALREFKRLAKELDIPVLVLAQLSRAGDTGDRRPKLSDLRGSGGIEEVADTVLLLHRPDYHDQSDRPGLIEVEIGKARDAERGAVINLRNDYAHMRALDWDGDVPMRRAVESVKRWGKGTGVAA
jgi:replicative DNA helicase